MARALSNVIGFDDAPFERSHRGDVRLVGAVCSRTRLDGVVSSRVRRDGANSTQRMIEFVNGAQFREHVRAILVQGIAVAGFNVVDLELLHRELGVPVLAVCRRRPDLPSIEKALFSSVPGAARKWRLIQRAGPVEPLRGVSVHRVGLDRAGADALMMATTLQDNIPEALRMAHLIAGGVTTGASRGRA